MIYNYYMILIAYITINYIISILIGAQWWRTHLPMQVTKSQTRLNDWAGAEAWKHTHTHTHTHTWCGSVTKLYLTILWPHGLQPTMLLCPWDFPAKNTEVRCHFVFWGIFPTQESNPWFLYWQTDSLPLSHQGNLINSIFGAKIKYENINSIKYKNI